MTNSELLALEQLLQTGPLLATSSDENIYVFLNKDELVAFKKQYDSKISSFEEYSLLKYQGLIDAKSLPFNKVIAIAENWLEEIVKEIEYKKSEQEHINALTAPLDIELPIIRIYEALILYAHMQHNKYKVSIGERKVVPFQWKNCLNALIDLSATGCGRIDPKKFEEMIVKLGMDNDVDITQELAPLPALKKKVLAKKLSIKKRK